MLVQCVPARTIGFLQKAISTLIVQHVRSNTPLRGDPRRRQDTRSRSRSLLVHTMFRSIALSLTAALVGTDALALSGPVRAVVSSPRGAVSMVESWYDSGKRLKEDTLGAGGGHAVGKAGVEAPKLTAEEMEIQKNVMEHQRGLEQRVESASSGSGSVGCPAHSGRAAEPAGPKAGASVRPRGTVRRRFHTQARRVSARRRTPALSSRTAPATPRWPPTRQRWRATLRPRWSATRSTPTASRSSASRQCRAACAERGPSCWRHSRQSLPAPAAWGAQLPAEAAPHTPMGQQPRPPRQALTVPPPARRPPVIGGSAHPTASGTQVDPHQGPASRGAHLHRGRQGRTLRDRQRLQGRRRRARHADRRRQAREYQGGGGGRPPRAVQGQAPQRVPAACCNAPSWRRRLGGAAAAPREARAP